MPRSAAMVNSERPAAAGSTFDQVMRTSLDEATRAGNNIVDDATYG